MPKANTNTKQTLRKARGIARVAFWICLLSAFLAGGIYAAQRIEQFFIHDPHFLLAAPEDYGQESPNLQIEGVQYASRAQILRMFAPDLGRSLYLFPMADRRRGLLKINWIQDASIVRVWPNHVTVRVHERQPAAFVAIPFGPMSRYALIDAAGVILEPPARARFNLPVLTGVSLSENEAARSRAVRRMQGLMRDLGPLASRVSEVDAGDLDNLKVRLQMQNQMALLYLGDGNFASRLRMFLDNYQDIQTRKPGVSTFDLRIDENITAIEGPPNAQ